MPRRVILLAVPLLLCSAAAAAKSEKAFTYRPEVVWNTAIRFLRAEQGYTLRDRDQEAGYILFIYPGQGAVKECEGSLEIFDFVDDRGYRQVKVQLTIAHQPSYIERHLLERLEQKLLNERGTPPPPERAPRDKDSEGDEDKGKSKGKGDGKGKSNSKSNSESPPGENDEKS